MTIASLLRNGSLPMIIVLLLFLLAAMGISVAFRYRLSVSRWKFVFEPATTRRVQRPGRRDTLGS